MKYIKKYKIDLEVLCKGNSSNTERLLIDILKDYFLEGRIRKIKEMKMTKEEIENWIDFDDDKE